MAVPITDGGGASSGKTRKIASEYVPLDLVGKDEMLNKKHALMPFKEIHYVFPLCEFREF